MSLSSRLSSLFFQDASTENNQHHGYVQPELDSDLNGAQQNRQSRAMPNVAEEEIDIELRRPPYYQVSAICVVSSKSFVLING